MKPLGIKFGGTVRVDILPGDGDGGAIVYYNTYSAASGEYTSIIVGTVIFTYAEVGNFVDVYRVSDALDSLNCDLWMEE